MLLWPLAWMNDIWNFQWIVEWIFLTQHKLILFDLATFESLRTEGSNIISFVGKYNLIIFNTPCVTVYYILILVNRNSWREFAVLGFKDRLW